MGAGHPDAHDVLVGFGDTFEGDDEGLGEAFPANPGCLLLLVEDVGGGVVEGIVGGRDVDDGRI